MIQKIVPHIKSNLNWTHTKKKKQKVCSLQKKETKNYKKNECPIHSGLPFHHDHIIC